MEPIMESRLRAIIRNTDQAYPDEVEDLARFVLRAGLARSRPQWIVPLDSEDLGLPWIELPADPFDIPGLTGLTLNNQTGVWDASYTVATPLGDSHRFTEEFPTPWAALAAAKEAAG